MKALVTGGAGFIGSHVAEFLVNDGHDVFVLDDLSGGFENNIPPHAKSIIGSITDNDLVSSLFEQEKFDYVYHLAAYAAENLSHFIRRFNYNNNLIGSVNLINQSIIHKVKCFVFTSSIGVYGENQLPMVESLVPCPEDPYGISKYAIELDLKSAYKNFGLNHIIFRPHNVYGERQNINDKYRNVIGIFMKQLLNGESLNIFGDGNQTRAFSYINDITPIICNSVFKKSAYNEVFNIGSNEVTTVNEVAELICKAFDKPSAVKHLRERNEVKHAYANHDKIKKYFETGSETTINKGILTMAKWTLNNSKYLGPSKSFNTEISFGLPEGW